MKANGLAPRKPNFFIVGAPKSGTTSLFSLLAEHPEVFVPSHIKEPHFFNRQDHPDSEPWVLRDESRYLALFQDAGEALAVGEASPSYLRDRGAPALIKAFSPDAKIIILLRNPINRAFSHYLMSRRLGRTGDSFQTLMGATADGSIDPQLYHVINLRSGEYSRSLQLYRETFGADNIMVLVFEEYVRDIPAALAGVHQFLGLSKIPIELASVQVRNSAQEPANALSRWLLANESLKIRLRHLVPFKLRNQLADLFVYRSVENPKMDEASRSLLRDYYYDDVEALSVLLGRKLPWPEFFPDLPSAAT